MDHNHAVDSHAVERYLLSEMSPEERDAFEDHYFSCSECAEGVRAAWRFRDDARIHLGSNLESAPPPAKVRQRRGWWSIPQLVPIGVAAALAGMVGFMVGGLEIPERERRTAAPVAAQAMVSVALHGVTRGEAEHIPPGGDFFSVYFDVPAPGGVTPYECEVTASNGKVAARIGALPRKNEQVNLLLPRINFRAGSYTLTVREGKLVVSQHNFIVE